MDRSYGQQNQLLGIEDVLQVDSRLLIGSNKRVLIRKGAASFTRQSQTSSSLSNGQILWQVNLNSEKSTIIDSYMYQQLNCSVTINATGLTGTVQNYLANNFALRQFPIASVTSTNTVQINNQQISCNPRDFVHQISWSQPDFIDKSIVQSICPIFPDQTQQYNDAIGSLISPLNNYTQGSSLQCFPRGVFNNLFTTTTGTTGTWQFNMTLTEPIFNPILTYSPDTMREGFAYVTQFNLSEQFSSNLSRMFSLNTVACPNITSISVNITGATLIQDWLTIPSSMILPEMTLRSFNTIISQPTLGIPIAPGVQFTIQSQSFSFNQIPKNLWVYCNNSATDVSTGYGLTDTMCSIQQISVLFNNRQSLLSNMSSVDLYNNCMADCGSRITYVQSQSFVGSVLQLDIPKLFGLNEWETDGMLGTYNFSIQVIATNISNSTFSPNVWVIQSLDSIMTTTNASISNIIQGYITKDDVIRANTLSPSPSLFQERTIYGGGFIDTLKDIGSKILGVLRDGKVLSTVSGLIPHPAAQAVSVISRNLGLGVEGGRVSNRREARRNLKGYILE
jgi:hypothetical protein